MLQVDEFNEAVNKEFRVSTNLPQIEIEDAFNFSEEISIENENENPSVSTLIAH